jgi:predicted  nucleic acid-binding Zn-ribbon protein
MELTMSSDELTILLNNILSQVAEVNRKQDRQSDDITEIKLQTQRTNGRVTALEASAKAAAKAIKTKRPILTDKSLYLLALAAVIVAITIATALGVNVGGLFT